MTSGGFVPKGEHDANVSATGGNGSKTGQPTRVAPGGQWRTAGELAATQGSAPMKVANSAPARQPLPAPTGITEYSELPDQSIMDGAAIGAGSNTLNLTSLRTDSGFEKSIADYAPVLNFIASRETTSNSTREAISLLLRGATPQ